MLKKFIKAGGLDHAYAYAKERSRQYGFPPLLSSWSKYTIIRSAIRANDYGHFEIFVNEFITDEFISDLKYRAFDIAGFYKKNENYKKAIEIYKMLLVSLPESGDLLNEIGNAYMSLDNRTEAEKYFQRATEVSTK
ncbi:tetratricopeptide repeat protein [Robertkochia solimangrovi]|uniref:tetratricopeptide repeat protein n=1 Tax=Robertkochia solimangrovi TaxID=2213046 RepID=UPI00117C5C5D|nr:tetratricopeptide repeat protein [Robertkochia solimangrovi]TRZ43119.1 hypothetical protein DMZ48_10515 [Robertkochia solimangrovi]